MDVKRQNGNEFTEETRLYAGFLDFYYTTDLATAQVTERNTLNENSKTGIIYFKIVSFNFVFTKKKCLYCEPFSCNLAIIHQILMI